MEKSEDQCELCGSLDIVKTGDDLFRCRNCGCKYTAAEAKKILFGEVTFRPQEFEIIGGRLVKYRGAGTEVVIPDTVTVIGGDAFDSCSGITSVAIPDSVRSIEDDAFKGCSSLQEIRIPGSVTTLGRCFYSCTALKRIVIPDPVTSMSETFMDCTSLGSVQLSGSVESIGRWTFRGCTSLKEIVIPEGTKVISWSAFEGCTALKKITLPYSLQEFSSEGIGRGRYYPWNEMQYIEGNIKPYCDFYTHDPDCRKLMDPYYRRPRYTPGEKYPPAFVVQYTEGIRAQRRAGDLCENCGGAFKGVFKKVCRECGMEKTY